MRGQRRALNHADSPFGHHAACRQVAHAHAMLAVLPVQPHVSHQEETVSPDLAMVLRLAMIDVCHRQIPLFSLADLPHPALPTICRETCTGHHKDKQQSQIATSRYQQKQQKYR
ncbi:hypothetical protein NUTIK01_19010 [Novosphingobium sp. IK01]|uniref:Uncharacterized protein n=1 Tax=Novosphingobium pituita TaxID=3056842 RepID=A0ABQ6P9Q6_9SPHN|nr:hypothetical protein NUTIK01_19010 [Novosphingobium sp. IK01]